MLDLTKWFRAPEEKSSRTSQLIALQSQGRARWTPRDIATLTREGYMKNAIVHRAVRLLAETVASVTWLACDGEAEHDTHPLLDLMARPNPRQDGAAFLESAVAHLQLAGNAYLEAVTLDGRPRELYALRPDRMRVVPGADGWPEAYEYHIAGRSLRFEQAQTLPPILHLTHFHPLDDHYGFAPLEAAGIAVDTHNAAAAWNKSLLDNAARPSGALVYSGPEASVLDMDFLDAKHNAAREIALCFGVPPMLLGIPGDNTYSNYQEANRAFFRGTVLPLASRIGGALSQWLAPAYGGNVRLAIDADRIEALSADRAALWARVTAAPFLTLNEKRIAVGYAPVEGGDGLG